MIRRELLNTALVSMLATATGKQVGLGVVPPNPVLPYVIVYPIASPEATGTMKDPDEDREHMYQITSIGEDYRQTGWMSDRVQVALMARSGNGFTTALVVAGGNVHGRSSTGLGPIIQSGEKLFQVNDKYTLYVGV